MGHIMVVAMECMVVDTVDMVVVSKGFHYSIVYNHCQKQLECNRH